MMPMVWQCSTPWRFDYQNQASPNGALSRRGVLATTRSSAPCRFEVMAFGVATHITPFAYTITVPNHLFAFNAQHFINLLFPVTPLAEQTMSNDVSTYYILASSGASISSNAFTNAS